MHFSHVAAALCVTVGLSGCATSAVITDLEEDKVIVESHGADFSAIQAQARKGCAIHGRTPVSISKVCLDGFCTSARYLFACKK